MGTEAAHVGGQQTYNDSIVGLGPCAACGHDPACGWAQVNDDWLCHTDDHSCYVPQPLGDLGAFGAILVIPTEPAASGGEAGRG